jgi:putative radical SAM enzyme (TIGR03279 family)
VSDARAGACGGVVVADARDAAERGGLRAGDRIVRLNGHVPMDVLDVEDAAADGTLWLSVLRHGHPLDLVVTPVPGEWHGISLDRGGLGDDPRTCRNACRFCFVDQVPPGLRGALSVKDDDYRLSFLHGNFTTLTNLGEDDLERIEELRLSPLYVSLHAWDDDARVRLMGRAAAGSRAVLERLATAGLVLHLQVVLCPGWNDGAVLAETVRRTAELDAVADLGVVPVSLAAEGDLRRVTADEARALVADVEAWQRELRKRRGTTFVHAADEFYLLAGDEPPAGDAPEQYENGVGISADLVAEAEALAAAWSAGGRAVGAPGPPREGITGVRLLGGTLARPVLERLTDTQYRRWAGHIITTIAVIYLAQGCWLLVRGEA